MRSRNGATPLPIKLAPRGGSTFYGATLRCWREGMYCEPIPLGGGMLLSARSAEQSGSGGLSASEALQRDPAAGALWRAWAFSGPDSESGENRQRSTTTSPYPVRGRGKPFGSAAFRGPR